MIFVSLLILLLLPVILTATSLIWISLVLKYLSDFCRSLYLEDAWRKLHPRVRACSWFNSNFSIGSRLDKFLVSRNLLPLVQSCDISPCAFSDHDFVNLSLKLDSKLYACPGLWKFNSSLMNCYEFECFEERSFAN